MNKRVAGALLVALAGCQSNVAESQHALDAPLLNQPSAPTPRETPPLDERQKVTVVLMQVGTPGEIDGRQVDDAAATLNEFAHRMDWLSRGHAKFDFDIHGPYVLPASDCRANWFDGNMWAFAEAVRQADPEVDFSAVEQTFVLVSYGEHRGDCEFRGYGMATSGGYLVPFLSNEGRYTRKMLLAGSDNDADTLVHEWGHTQGAFHLAGMLCYGDDGQRVPVYHPPAGLGLAGWIDGYNQHCPSTPEASYVRLDPMGGAFDKPFLAARMFLWGWLSKAELPIVTETQELVVLAPEDPRTGVHGIRIPFRDPRFSDFQPDSYVFELHTHTEYNQGYPFAEPGVYAFADDSYRDLSTNIQWQNPRYVEPPPYQPNQWWMPLRPLTVGVPFVDESIGVRITVRELQLKADPPFARILVEYF